LITKGKSVIIAILTIISLIIISEIYSYAANSLWFRVINVLEYAWDKLWWLIIIVIMGILIKKK
jgi:hypothetical protein